MKIAYFMLALFCLASDLPTADAADATKPNIIVFLTDDHGYLKDEVLERFQSMQTLPKRLKSVGYVTASVSRSSSTGKTPFLANRPIHSQLSRWQPQPRRCG